MSLNLPALTGANTILQLVYDLNQVKVVAANTTSPIFSTSLKVNGFAQLGSTTDGVVIENNSGAFSISNAAYIRRNSSSGDLEIYASSSASRNLIFGSSSGAERARIDSNGTMHIGGVATYAPVGGLNILGSAGEPVIGSVLNELLRLSNDTNISMAFHGGTTSNNTIYFGRAGTGGNSKGKIQYNHASDYLSIDTAGAERARIDSNGNLGLGISPATNHGFTRIIHASGSYSALTLASTSSRTFTLGSGDASFQIWDTTAGSERMRIDSSGNLLVGTTTGYGKFAVSGTDAVATAFITGATNLVRIIPDSAYNTIESTNLAQSAFAPMRVGGSSILFHTGGTDRVTIDSSGNVGIGTSTLPYKLNIYGNQDGAVASSLQNGSAGTSAYAISVLMNNLGACSWWLNGSNRTADGGAGTSTIRNDVGNLRLQSSAQNGFIIDNSSVIQFLGSGASEQARLDNNGNLGIGTTSPSTWGRLAVVGASGGSEIIGAIVNTSGTADSRATLILDPVGNGAGSRESKIVARTNGSNQTTLEFYTANGATPAEAMRIDSNGNLGIGTSSPSGSLHISTSSPQIYLTDTDTGGDSRISAGSSAGSLFFDADINNEVASSIIQFSIDGTERARIDGNGLRIGATAEVVTSPGGELLSLQGTATKSPLAVKSSDVTSIHSWNTGSSAATRYHFIGWNPAGNQEFHLRRETDSSIRLTSLQAALQLDGNNNGIYFKDNTNFEDKILQRPILKDYGETSTSPSSSSGTLTLDISNGNNFQVTLTENISAITISNPTASGNVCSISVRFVQGASAYTVAWPASFKWAGGSAGSVSTGNGDIDILTAITWDGGTTWYAVLNNDFS